ncbi:unnamed protein product [Owenia fusiformis]|uniref:Uncharacterized protein n=1 Tax=Owenia fusiformis TaxID=6347 RepID=A0A8J1TM65_OWEFU|nr:unnamed protein product [Owenia fusiformis]
MYRKLLSIDSNRIEMLHTDFVLYACISTVVLTLFLANGDFTFRTLRGVKHNWKKGRKKIFPTDEYIGEVNGTSINVIIHRKNEIKRNLNTLVCADIQVILDLSCSVGAKTKREAKSIAGNVTYELINLDTTRPRVKVGIMTYSENIKHILRLDKSQNETTILDAFANMSLEKSPSDLCRTSTHIALEETRTILKHIKKTDRTQIILLFTDGLTFLRRYRNDLYATAKDLKDSGVIIHIIELPHRRGKYQNIEFATLAHSHKHRYKGTDCSNVANDVFERILSDAAPCPDIGLPYYSKCAFDWTLEIKNY